MHMLLAITKVIAVSSNYNEQYFNFYNSNEFARPIRHHPSSERLTILLLHKRRQKQELSTQQIGTITLWFEAGS